MFVSPDMLVARNHAASGDSNAVADFQVTSSSFLFIRLPRQKKE